MASNEPQSVLRHDPPRVASSQVVEVWDGEVGEFVRVERHRSLLNRFPSRRALAERKYPMRLLR